MAFHNIILLVKLTVFHKVIGNLAIDILFLVHTGYFIFCAGFPCAVASGFIIPHPDPNFIILL